MTHHLTHHLAYLRRHGHDVRLRPAWGTALAMIEDRRRALTSGRGGCWHRHQEASSRLAEVAALEEWDFPEPPPPEAWIVYALDRRSVHETLRMVRRDLTALVANESQCVVQLKCGIKPRASILAKINGYRAGVEELDLWDSTRGRVTVPDLGSAVRLARNLCQSANVVRLRNYPRRPRWAADDPYRAIHAVVMTAAGSYEVQFVTELRAAIGEIDHELARKRSLPYESAAHEEWLRELSMTANVIETELLP